MKKTQEEINAQLLRKVKKKKKIKNHNSFDNMLRIENLADIPSTGRLEH